MKRTRMHAKDRKTAIVMAALPLFARQGYAETTTRHIAQAAGISEALLYRHFPSKEALYAQIQELCCSGNDPATRKMVHVLTELEPSTSTLIHIVYFLTRALVMGDAIGPIPWETRQRLMVKSLLEDGAYARSLFQNRFKAVWDRIEASLVAAVASGDAVTTPLTRGNPARFGHHVAAWIALVYLPPKPAIDYKAAREEVVHQALWFALRGMGLTDKALATHYNPKALELFFATGPA